jgi:5-methylcytosine-specific restriction endonuclease McrA
MRRLAPSVIRPNGMIKSRIPLQLRKAVYERDSYTCQDCGLQGRPGRNKGSIQAYHIKSLRDGGEHALGNLVTVCYNCRRQRDEERRKDRPISRSSFRWRKRDDK